jgi:hypothetical protein
MTAFKEAFVLDKLIFCASVEALTCKRDAINITVVNRIISKILWARLFGMTSFFV